MINYIVDKFISLRVCVLLFSLLAIGNWQLATLYCQPAMWEKFDTKKARNLKEFKDTVDLLLVLQNPSILKKKSNLLQKLAKFRPISSKRRTSVILNLPPVNDDPDDVYKDEKEEENEKEPDQKQAEEIIKKLGGYCKLDERFEQYLINLAKKIEGILEGKDKEKKYTYVVIDSPILNAFITSSGGNSYRVHFFKGLIEAMTSEAELIAVIGHEIGHSTSCDAELCPSQTDADRMSVKYMTKLEIDPYSIAYALNRIKLSKLLNKTKFPKEVPKRWREASTKIDQRVKKIDDYIKQEDKPPKKGDYLAPEYASFKIQCK